MHYTFHAFQQTELGYDRLLFIVNNSETALVCASYCALHLNLAIEMKESAFIRAFGRFVARQEIIIIKNDNFRIIYC